MLLLLGNVRDVDGHDDVVTPSLPVARPHDHGVSSFLLKVKPALRQHLPRTRIDVEMARIGAPEAVRERIPVLVCRRDGIPYRRSHPSCLYAQAERAAARSAAAGTIASELSHEVIFSKNSLE